MKIYITSPSQIVTKWMILFLFGPLWFGMSFVLFFYGQPVQPNTYHTEVLVSLFTLCISFYLFYLAIVPNVLLIENDKIILKGTVNDISYGLYEFKEIAKKNSAQNVYTISFTDGKSFNFYPGFSLWYRFTTTQKEKIADLNNQINGIIKEQATKG